MGEPAVPRAIDVDRAMPWAAAAIVALAVASGRYPAMIDLPCHEEIVGAMRHFGDPARYPPGLMRWNLGHPNQLFYILAGTLSLAVPVDIACKLVVAGSAAAVPLGAARLADHLGISRASSLFAAPLALGFFFYFGFVGNLLALGMLMTCLPGLDRLARSPGPATAARGTATLAVLYAAHESAFVIGVLSVVVLSIGRPWIGRAAAWRWAPLVATGTLTMFEEAYAVRHNGPNLRALPQVIDLGFDQKLRNLPQALLGLHGDGATRPAFVAIAAGLALLVVQRGLSAHAPMRQPITLDLLERHRFIVLGSALVIAYFTVPFAFAGAMWLHARFLGPAIAVLGVALAPALPRRPWWPTRWVAMIAVVLVVRLVEPAIVETSQVYADLDALLPAIAPGSGIAALDLVGLPAGHLVLTAGGAAARAASERGGRMAASFTQASPIPLVVVAPEHRWEDSFLRMSRDTLSFEPARDLRRFRYVLALAAPREGTKLSAALEPEARLVGRSGPWLLFESTLDVAPLLSEEETPSPQETYDSVRMRLDRQ